MIKDKKRKVTDVYKFGIVKHKKDKRDYKYASTYLPTELPKSFSLKKYVLAVKQQGKLSSCAPHAFASCYEIMKNIKLKNNFQTSERYLYYKVRELEATLPNNVGTQLRDNAKILNQEGIALEVFCPYSEIDYNVEPTWAANFSARFSRIKSYNFVKSVQEIKDAIASYIPTATSLQVFSGFYNLTGILIDATGTLQGGHAMCIIGYDDDKQAFEVLNSWGSNWGNGGFCWISYKYVEEHGLNAGYASMTIEV